MRTERLIAQLSAALDRAANEGRVEEIIRLAGVLRGLYKERTEELEKEVTQLKLNERYAKVG